MRLLILRPLNRVKVMVWARFKIGILDLVVFVSTVVLWATMSFLVFSNPIISAGVGILGGFSLASLLLVGEPGRRFYNYFIIFLTFLVSKKKYKGDDIYKMNPYLKIKNDEVFTKDKFKTRVFRIYGNDLGQNLDNVIENCLNSFEEVFRGQSLTYQIVKQDRKAELKDHLKSLDKSPRGEEIRNENKRIVASINEGEKFYAHYFIEFSSSKASKLNLEAENIQNSFNASGLRVQKLENEKLAEYLLRKLAPNVKFKDAEIKRDGNGIIDFNSIWGDVLLGKNITFKSSYLKIGDTFQKNIAVDRYPLYTTLSFLGDIFSMEHTTVILQSRGINTSEAIKMLNKAYVEMNTRINSKGNKLSDNKEQAIYLDSMEELMESIQGAGEELKATNVYVTIYGNTLRDLIIREREVLKIIKRNRMKIDKLKLKQMASFLALPSTVSSSIENRNQLEIGTKALSHSWPFVAQSFNDKTGDFIGRAIGGKPCFLDWRLRSEKLNRHQSNSVIFGATGGGKTTFTKKLLKDEWSRGVNCYVMDPEGEYAALAKNVGGVTIDLSGVPDEKGEIQRLNPLQVFVGDGGSNDDWIASHFKFLNDFFSQLLYPSLKDTVIQMNYLKFAIQGLYKKKGIENANVVSAKPEKFPIISDLHKELLRLSNSKTDKTFSKNEIFQELSERLYDLTSKGADGNLWDGKTSLDIENQSFVSFDFKNLINSGNSRLIGAQSYLAFKYILHVVFLNKDKAMRKGIKQNVSITIDEAHKFINPQNPTGVLFAFSMYKQIRKYHGWIRMTTQNIADFTADAIIKKETSAIINNSQFLFVFKLKPRDIEDLNDLIKTSGGLSRDEKSFLSREQSHQYLFISGTYRTAVKIDYSDKEKEIMGWVKYKGDVS